MSAGDLEAAARLAARGDRVAFADVCGALSDDVWRYCLALTGDRELAFEASQDTFVRAVTGIRRFRGDGPVRVWMLVLARRAVADLLRREGRRRDRPVEHVPDTAEADASGVVDLHELVDRLPDDQRQAFVLTQLVGLTYDQAAKVADCRVGTIRSRVFRARERLVAAVSEDRGAESDAN